MARWWLGRQRWQWWVRGGSGVLNLGAAAAVNTVPVAFDAEQVVLPGGALSGVLRGGDADGDAVTYTLVALPTQGVVTLVDASTGAFGYTANMGASGTDTFTFKVNDGSVDSAVAVVTVRFASLGIVPGIAVGVSHSVALQTDGTLWSWGINSNGELGDGSLVRRLTPVRVRAFDGTVFDEGVSVVAGGNHTLVERGDGTWWGWGSNLYGQLGDGTTVTPRLTPVQVSVVPSLATLMGGVIHTAALKTDGTVWGWGRNNQGQLGDGTTTQRSTPVQVSGLSGVVQIALSVDGSHTVALRNDGTVWTWGFNSNGQLGDGTATSRSLPVQVRKVDGTVLDGVVSVAAGSGHTVALGGDGRVWAWGLDNAGQLGNAQSNSTTPVLVLHTDGTVFQGVVSIEAFGLTSLAVTADGTRWGWGGGSSGELGNGVFANNAHPVVLPALVDIAALVHGSTHTLARTAGGELRTWGINSNGQLGDGTVVARAAAVAVVGSGGSGVLNLGAAAAVNTVPVAFDAEQVVLPGGALSGVLRGGDADGDAVTYTLVALPTQGVVTLVDASTGAFGYTANMGASGTDTFTFKVNDGSVDSAVAVVTVRFASLGIVPGIAVGVSHSVALQTDGTLWSWGINSNGELGDGSLVRRLTPVRVRAFDGTVFDEGVSVVAGGNHTLVERGDGTWWGWGSNLYGQLGDGTTVTPRLTPVQVSVVPSLATLMGGVIHTAALKTDGTVWGWGRNNQGQLGDGTTTQRSTPVQVSGLSGVVQIALSVDGSHTVALRNDGTVWTWGFNSNGQLGDGTATSRSLPVQVRKVDGTVLDGVVSVAAGSGHTVALGGDGRVWAWGLDNAGQLGNAQSNSTTPVLVLHTDGTVFQGVVSIEAFGLTSLAVTADGTRWGWGGGSSGELGNGVFANNAHPVVLPALVDIAALVHGSTHTLARTAGGELRTWGINSNGQLGDGTVVARAAAVAVVGSGGSGVLNLGAAAAVNTVPVAFDAEQVVLPGGALSGVLRGGDADGDAVTYTLVALPTQGVVTLVDASTGAFGYTANMGASGTDTFTFKVNDGSVDSAVAVVTVRFASLGIVPGIAVGVSHSVALQTDGTLWSWGINSNGELGDGSLVRRLTPVRVRAFDGTVFDEGVSVVAGGNHTLVERGDGTWWGWGSNLYGQLGDGTTVTPRLTPVQVSVVPSLATLMGGVIHTAALKTDGTVWGWGRNNQGQLGDGTTTQRSTPVQVSGLSGVVQIALSVDGSHTVALRNDGTVWTWGFNSNGQLGDGTATSRSLPVQVRKVDGTVLDGVVSVAAGSGHTVALGGDGRVWAWGLDNAGQLGNAQSNSTTPVLVLHTDGTVFQGVVSIEAFGLTSLAVTADGTRWGWGGGSSGELGNGVFANNAHPVVLPALVDIAALVHGSTHTLARTAGGELRTWGINSNGQLGDGTVVARAAAVAVVDPVGGNLGVIAGNPRPLASDFDFATNDVDTYTGVLDVVDFAGDPLTFSIVALGNKGVPAITNAATGAFTYTPNANTTGVDTFTFKANDGVRDSNVATATMTIIDTVPPQGVITVPTNFSSVSELFLIEGTASDNASGVALVELQITDGTFYVNPQGFFVLVPTLIPLTGTTTWSFNTSPVNWTPGTNYTVTAFITDADGAVGVSPPASFTFTGGATPAFATLDLTLSTSSILFNGMIDASVKLTKAGDPAANLTGNPVVIKFTHPDAAETALAPVLTNEFGQATLQDIGGVGSGVSFDKKGTWSARAEFAGTAALAPANSSDELLLVGTAAGYAVLVQGRLANQEGLASHNKTTNRMYQILKDRGFADQNIFYFNFDATQDANGDGTPDNQQADIGVDAVPSKAGIQSAIEGLAAAVNGNPAPVYVMMVDHGGDEKFFLDGAETILPSELDGWLDTLEAGLTGAALNEPRVVIVGACYSGGFIDDLAGANRLVITSAAANEESYKGPLEPDGIRSGEFFLEELFQSLGKGDTFADAFNLATDKTEVFTRRGGSRRTPSTRSLMRRLSIRCWMTTATVFRPTSWDRRQRTG